MINMKQRQHNANWNSAYNTCTIPVKQENYPFYAMAQLCPVCKGEGKITKVETYGNLTSCRATYQVTCHGCNGTGWVTVYQNK